MSKQEIRQELSEFLLQNYNGSFSRMACDYIHATGMKEEEVEALLEAMRESKSMELTTKESLTHKVLTSGCRSEGVLSEFLMYTYSMKRQALGNFRRLMVTHKMKCPSWSIHAYD